ncbi:DNA-binding response regulator [Mycetocola tolaasinivorans]|uniref:DNA-binding response regulator n=1 Tax=Mycetocola tolaasinivorans TaxID=76635 RepID=A0A3L7A4R9_9MICO|nr:response regulator transcription factor [Mycetocola tolaasinivorans]RLP75343.1 DNA-binding response regulator [Mycetocola tolaasinivorans]
MSPIRVLLVDDQALLRAGFRIILDSQPDIEVVGEAESGLEAIAAAERLSPDVICMDIQMPGMDGLAATEILRTGSAAILVLTTFDEDAYLFAALRAGAAGFLLKNSTPEQLIDAVRVVHGGDALLSPTLTRRVIERFTPPEPEPESPAEVRAAVHPAPPTDLTDREREVLELLARGLSNQEIAGRLFVGEATVKTHVSRVLQKLGVRDRIQAVVFAYERGLVIPGQNPSDSETPAAE